MYSIIDFVHKMGAEEEDFCPTGHCLRHLLIFTGKFSWNEALSKFLGKLLARLYNADFSNQGIYATLQTKKVHV